jgi:tRNA pseudouridine(55) synthase
MNPNNTKKTSSGQSIIEQSQGIFHVWKYPGETLAVLLRRFRDTQALPDTEKLTYAGRLDPMAEGIVPVLIGAARFQKDHMMSASKTYEIKILLGLQTDTGDMLGLITKKHFSTRQDLCIYEEKIKEVGELTELVYPSYSSRPVDGKPLFVHARAGNKVTLPVKKITIHSIELVKIQEYPLGDLLQQSIDVIKTVQGDFRQEEITQQWSDLCKNEGNVLVQILQIKTTVSSGTYMRSLAEKIGEFLGVPALAYTIVRTSIEIKK